MKRSRRFRLGRSSSSRLGRYGEDLVCGLYGFSRQPASGAAWPWKEDLVRRDVTGWFVAQVKTTRDRSLVQAWERLTAYAKAEEATPVWYTVVVGPGKDYVLETRLVEAVDKGPAAIGERPRPAKERKKSKSKPKSRQAPWRRRQEVT